jgi:hypothetical protein
VVLRGKFEHAAFNASSRRLYGCAVFTIAYEQGRYGFNNSEHVGLYIFLYKINVFSNQLNNALEVCMVMTAVDSKFGLPALRVEEPFAWS